MIKKIVSAFLAALIMFIIPVNCMAETEYKKIEIPVPHNLLFLGDSIATGYGLEGYSDGKDNCNSYANQLTEKYSQELSDTCQVTEKNAAVDGKTSKELLEELKSGMYDSQLKDADAV
ncbi:MAG: SGNH/GDSL hydrolase family protein, partial [Oscillospiraceae bacterium]